MEIGPAQGARWRAVRRAALGIAAALAMLAGYEWILRPVRMAYVEHLALPAFEAIDTPRSRQFEVRRRTDVTVGVIAADAPDSYAIHYAAPAGVLFLLGAGFLVLLFPLRPYWLILLGYHLSLGVVGGILFALGIGWWEEAFALFRFSRGYVSDAVGLLVPLVLFLRGRQTERRDPDREGGGSG